MTGSGRGVDVAAAALSPYEKHISEASPAVSAMVLKPWLEVVSFLHWAENMMGALS
jgi:hypothetical protein